MKLTMLQQLRNSQKLTSEIQALGHAKVKLEIQLKETRVKSQDDVRTLKSSVSWPSDSSYPYSSSSSSEPMKRQSLR